MFALKSEKEPYSLWPLTLLGILISFFGLFARVKIKPVNAETEEKYPRDNATHKEKPLPSIVTKELGTAKAKAEKNDAQFKRGKIHPYLKFGVNVLTLLAVAWYANEARRQRVAMEETLSEVQKQTPLMQQQVEGATAAIITKQFRITWPTKQAYLSVILDNRGRVIGSDIHGGFHLAEISLPDLRVVSNALPNWEFSIPEMGPSPDLPMERGTYLNISQEELKGRPMPRAIKLTGTFTYSNGFRKKPESVCYYVLGAVEFRNNLGAVQQGGGPSVITCDGLPAQVAWYLQTQKDITAK